MILVASPNSSLDRTMVVPNFVPNKRHRISASISQPGGKGINVARTLKHLGLPVLCVGFTGGEFGRVIAAGLRREGIAFEPVAIAQENRSCLAILDPKSRTVTEIDEVGPSVTGSEMQKLTKCIAMHLPRASFAVFSGSLPPGAPADTYRRWVELSHHRKVLSVVDAAGSALAQALEAHPYLVKPNQEEAEELLGFKLGGDAAISRALDLLGQKAEVVAISLGERGAAIASQAGRWRIMPPAVRAVNTVGCGDAFLAGIIAGLTQERSLEDASRLAVAAGSANTLSPGAGTVPAQTIAKLEGDVSVCALA